MTVPPALYLMVGLPAAGKTTRARELEAEHGALRLSPDEWMIPLFGESNPAGKRDILEGRFVWLAHRALRVGTSVILDFGLWSRHERTALRALAKSAEAGCEVIYVPIDNAEQQRRIDQRWAHTPQHTFEITPAMLATYRGKFEMPLRDELEDGSLDPPPTGYGSWQEWAAWRWPSYDLQ